MNTLYVDCKYGISGDMMLTSLVDLGADKDYIEAELKKLPIEKFEMTLEKTMKQGIACLGLHLSFEPHQHHHGHEDKTEHHSHEHNHAREIFSLIEASELAPRVKERGLALFHEVARAESKIHGIPVDEVHFHEVGAMDSIIDTLGVCLALESLEIEEVIFHSVPTGSGMIHIAHGLFPVPAPATSEILVGVPLSNFDYSAELTTPTGASFAKVLASEYSEIPHGTIEKIGYGSGTKNFPHPNVLRTMLLKKKN